MGTPVICRTNGYSSNLYNLTLLCSGSCSISDDVFAPMYTHTCPIREAVPPDVYRNKPMCMFQYPLYSCCRIPGATADTLRRTSIQDSRHIVVIHNEHVCGGGWGCVLASDMSLLQFYKLDLLYETPTGELAVAPASHLVQQLKAIVVSDVEPCKFPVGLLTTEHRDTWYQAREKLNKGE